MWQKAIGEDGQDEGSQEVSIYEVVNTLVSYGHKKEEILKNYSREELTLFYEKCIKLNMRQNADFIECIAVGVGAMFSGGKDVEKLLKDMRK